MHRLMKEAARWRDGTVVAQPEFKKKKKKMVSKPRLHVLTPLTGENHLS